MRLMSTTRPRIPGLSGLSMTSIWSYSRNGLVAKIRNEQKMLDRTLYAAKNATAPTAAKPVNALHNTRAETPSRSSASSRAAA